MTASMSASDLAAPSRYHLTEPTVEIDGRVLGAGWLLITEDEYVALRTPEKAAQEAFDDTRPLSARISHLGLVEASRLVGRERMRRRGFRLGSVQDDTNAARMMRLFADAAKALKEIGL